MVKLLTTGFAVVALAGIASGTNFRLVRYVRQISTDTVVGTPGSESDTEAEPHIAVDPNDPATVVAVFQEGRFPTIGGSAALGISTSHDGGKTWTAGNLPGLTVSAGGSFDRGSDPVVAIGPDGAIYAQTLLTQFAGFRVAVAVQRSDDGGLSFNPPVVVDDQASISPFFYNDKNWIAVDTFPASPHYRRVYSTWDVFGQALQPIRLRYSDDRGDTWSALTEVSAPFGFGGTGSLPLVHPNGNVTIVYFNGAQISQTSHDGGQTFDPPVTIDTYRGTEPAGMRTNGIMPAAAVDAVTGYLYAAWQDTRFRSDGLNDIVLSVSTDGGLSWSAPVAVNDPGPIRLLNHFRPAMAADGGFVHITFWTRENQPNKVAMRYIVSADNGTTFSRERRIGRFGDLNFAAGADGKAFLGDYMGVTAAGNAAHAVWCLPSAKPHHAPGMHQTTWSVTAFR